MCKSIFITSTGTDIGKTYITGLLIKKMKELGYDSSYYKAALSGAESLENCDAGFVKNIANLDEDVEDLVSYIYKNPLSPHLASKVEGNPVEVKKIREDFSKISFKHDYIVVEGSGGIVCPIRYDEEKILLEDIIYALDTDVIVVSNATLGSINACVLTVSYLKSKNINIRGIIINNYEESLMQNDNIYMIKELTGVEILSVVEKDSKEIVIDRETIDKIFG